MSDDKAKDTPTPDQGLRQSVPDPYSGFVANDADGDSSIGHPDAGARAGASQSGINSNFAKASPESNVNAPGAPQASHGNATGDVPGGTRGKVWPEPGSQAADDDGAITPPPAPDDAR